MILRKGSALKKCSERINKLQTDVKGGEKANLGGKTKRADRMFF